MTSPVIVSRIQNRRGAQSQFNGFAYNPALAPPLTQLSIYPSDNEGLGYYPASVNTNFTPANYPNVLLPGELVICTDSDRVFMGSTNGAYIEIAEVVPGSGEYLQPTSWSLPPVSTFTVITRAVPDSSPPLIIPLDWNATPFFTITYSVTDSGSPDWNISGGHFSKNGQLKITGINPATKAPTPTLSASLNPVPFSSVSLIDNGVEVNTYPTFDISFNAVYQSGRIQLWYMHNFPGTLIFNTNTTTWVTF